MNLIFKILTFLKFIVHQHIFIFGLCLSFLSLLSYQFLFLFCKNCYCIISGRLSTLGLDIFGFFFLYHIILWAHHWFYTKSNSGGNLWIRGNYIPGIQDVRQLRIANQLGRISVGKTLVEAQRQSPRKLPSSGNFKEQNDVSKSHVF